MLFVLNGSNPPALAGAGDEDDHIQREGAKLFERALRTGEVFDAVDGSGRGCAAIEDDLVAEFGESAGDVRDGGLGSA